jgi:hypothetical protein
MQRTNPGTSGPSQPIANSQDPQQAIQQWQQSHPYGSPGSSVQDLNAYLNSIGIQSSIPTHAGGTQLSTDKIVLPDQSVWDVSNDHGWQTGIQDGYFVNGQPSSTPGVVTQAPEAPAFGPLGGGTTGLVNGQGYVLPSAQDALNSPGLQFALQQGEQGVLKNAAARGTLRSGGTLKDLANYDIGTALQGYGNLVNEQLAANQYNTGSLFNIANMGQAAAAGTAAAGQNYANSASGTLGNIGNANAANSIASGNAIANGINGSANSLWLAYLMNQQNQPNGGSIYPRTGGGNPYNGITSSPADYR